ncbi:hypothetical protein [Vibrio parahaemolyticus]|uniref:hypothetical protein n=1 Tax=Vibrio parahaemolyticus TaxID=670 RepID=UPI001020C190|nr:hypothetical protein [Vibrio parahaemolyticus]
MTNATKRILNKLRDNQINNSDQFVTDSVIQLYINKKLINFDDVDKNSPKFKWVKKVIYMELEALRLLEIEVVSNTFDDALAANRNKSSLIIDKLVELIISSIPNVDHNYY